MPRRTHPRPRRAPRQSTDVDTVTKAPDYEAIAHELARAHLASRWILERPRRFSSGQTDHQPATTDRP